jgi:hypothetical protein
MAPKRVDKSLKCVPYSPKINENLSKCLLEGVCAKNLTRVLKIVCYNPRKWPETDVFVKTHLQTILARRLPLVLLCITLWLVRGGGTVRVTKCIILTSVWVSNYRFHMHLNGPKSPETCTLQSKKK